MISRTRASGRALATAVCGVLWSPLCQAAEVIELPAVATEVINATNGNLPTYNGRDDGFGTASDLLDMTFTVCIDFLEKTSGERELIWETGAGTIGTSVVYESPSTLVMRTAGNGGFSLLTVSYPLSAGEIAAGALVVGWTYDSVNANGTQTASLIINGQIVATNELDVGGDWSGSDPAKFGIGGSVTGTGANGTIPSIAFASGTFDLVKGLSFYADTLWLPIADDTDADGIPDAWEEIYFPGDLTALSEGGDNDADGLLDEDEFENGTDPTDTDTDDDGLTDGREANQSVAGYTATDPVDPDSDLDGRSDGEEVDGAQASDPNERDTDGDRFIDGTEIAAGSDPGSAASMPPVGEFLCAYWPLDSLDGGSYGTPDLAGGGLDLEAMNFSAAAVVPGRIGNAIAFDGTAETLLNRDSAAGEDLPITQHQDYTIAMWVNIAGAGQGDRRIFSEGSRTNSNATFGLGTDNAGAADHLDVFLRGLTAGNNFEASVGTPLDGTWRHVAWVRYGESYELYIDGVLDAGTFAFIDPFADGTTTTTSIGGLQQSLASSWVTGLVDDVSTWKAALPVAQIAELASGLAADAIVEDGDSDGMPDRWEEMNGLDSGDPSDASISADADTLTNLQEYRAGTDPNTADTDGDGLPDDVESNTGTWASSTDTGTNPRRTDSDSDGLLDGVENPDLPYDSGNASNQPGSDPNIADSDGDLVDDGAEVTAGSDPTRAGSVPEPEAYFGWCPDDEPLGDTYGPDGVIAASGANPPSAGLEARGVIPVVAISENGAAQTGLAQTLDFAGGEYFTITPEPNSLRDILTVAAIEAGVTFELMISPDSLAGTNQYIFESGGTGDGHGLVLIGSTLYFGVNSGNNAPVGSAVASIDLMPLYGTTFSADDYLLVRASASPLSEIVLGVTHLGNGNSAVDSAPWTGNSWDGGDPLGLGGIEGGRGGDRGNQLSSLPGATVNWDRFDGQVAKFAVYPGLLPPVVNVNTELFRITAISIDGDDMITLEWASFPDERYSIFSSTDLSSFEFEIEDSVPSAGARTSLTFPNQQPGAPRIYFRVTRNP